MPTVTFKKAFSFVTAEQTIDYAADWSGGVSTEVVKAARAAKALKEKPRGSHSASPTGDADSSQS